MSYKTTSTALALVLALGGGTAFAAGDQVFTDADVDTNKQLSESEFEQTSRDVFTRWDADDSGRISENELYSGIFQTWDADDDNRLTESEYQNDFERWFDTGNRPEFAALDTDGDSVLTQNEFVKGLAQAQVAADWDAAGPGVDWQAFHLALYEVYDADADRNISEDEFARAGSTDMRTGDLETGDMQADAGEVGLENDLATGAVTPTEDEVDVVALSDWAVGDLYQGGVSVDQMFDDMEVHGPTGDEIGSIENVVFSDDGRVISVVAEVGGFWDMFDTHVNVPWDEIEMTADRIVIPVTEENVEDYAPWKTSYLTREDATETRVVDEDLAASPRLFRATDLIGDYARVRDAGAFVNYGYVNDLIIKDGKLEAVVVTPNAGYGVAGPYAYPYYGWGGYAGRPTYDLPYDREEVVEAERIDYERFAIE